MNQDYDIFEKLPDGTPLWRCHAIGLRECHEKLWQVAANSNNECFAICLATRDIVGRSNGAASATAK